MTDSVCVGAFREVLKRLGVAHWIRILPFTDDRPEATKARVFPPCGT
jgi:hypothetical protein